MRFFSTLTLWAVLSMLTAQVASLDICAELPTASYSVGDTIRLPIIVNDIDPDVAFCSFQLLLDINPADLQPIQDDPLNPTPFYLTYFGSGPEIHVDASSLPDDFSADLNVGGPLFILSLVVLDESFNIGELGNIGGSITNFFIECDTDEFLPFDYCSEVFFDGTRVNTVDLCYELISGFPSTTGGIVRYNIRATNLSNILEFNADFTFNLDNYEVIPAVGLGPFNLDIIELSAQGGLITGLLDDQDYGKSLPDGSVVLTLELVAIVDNPGDPSLSLNSGLPFFNMITNYLGELVDITYCQATYPSLSLRNLSAGIVADESDDCSVPQDTNRLPSWNLVLTNQSSGATRLIAARNDNGIVEDYLPSGTYDYFWVAPGNSSNWEICDNTGTVELTDSTVTEIISVASVLNDCYDPQVNISSGNLRPCFTNNPIYIQYANYGTQTTPASFIDITLDDAFVPLAASLPYTEVSENIYRFLIGDLAVGQVGSISMTVEIDCDYPVGNTLCATAIIYPNKDCPVDLPNYQGGEVEITSVCTGDSVRFTATNIGIGTTGEVDYVVIADGTTQLTGNIEILPNESTEFTFPATGATWRLEFQRPTGAPYLTHALSIVEGCDNSGATTSTGWVTAFSLLDFDLYYDRYCLETTAAYDPNDKTATPFGVGPDHFIFPNGTIDYRIRFQNTGTDTAFTVVVRDTIDTDLLDMSTFRPGISSHLYELSIVNENELIWTFNDIQLVDSFTNEPGSNGFLHYQISQQPELEDFTEINGRAGIYFDFNEVVLTEYSELTVARDFLVSSTKNYGVVGAPIKVFPNPANTQLRFSKANWPGEVVLRIYDGLGREIQSEFLNNSGATVNVAQLNNGVYFYRLSSNGRLLQTGNFVKE